MLEKINSKEISIEEAPDWANKQWKEYVGPGTGNHENKYEEGLRQAEKFRSLFVNKAKAWNWK